MVAHKGEWGLLPLGKGGKAFRGEKKPRDNSGIDTETASTLSGQKNPQKKQVVPDSELLRKGGNIDLKWEMKGLR